MSDPGAALDDLELKKRARRRLVGAAALTTFAAVVLPMVMDEAPPPVGRDVEIRIPGQDQVASTPLTAAKPAVSKPEPVAPALAAPAAKEPVAKDAAKTPAATGAEAPKPIVKEVAKAPAAKETVPEPRKDAKRAQAILDGRSGANEGAHVILIGAFSNKANVTNLETKLAQLGIKTYTEPLESPQGKKIRVRAGPFPSLQAAHKALDRMKRIGVNGIVAPKS